MKIIIKTLSGQNFPLEVEGTDTILQVKEKIQKVKDFDVQQQKLLRKGTLLDDKTTITDLGIQENEFLVVMVNAKKPAAQQPPQQAPVQQQPVVQPPPQQVQPPPQQPAPVNKPATTPVVPPSPQGPQGGDLVSGPEYDKAIDELTSMGYPKEECVAAMKAAFNNPNRAAEYLINGIPASHAHHPPTTTSQPPQGTGQVPPLGGAGLGGAGLGGAQGNMFAQLRQLYQQNPQAVLALLPQLVQQLSQSNPEVAAQLQQNPQLLLQLLTGGQPPAPGPNQIVLTQAEQKDIETIMSMGFSKQDALEAYLACDKNIEYAINYLFEKQANGDLFTQHLQREQANPQNQQPPGGNEPQDEEDDDDVYQ